MNETLRKIIEKRRGDNGGGGGKGKGLLGNMLRVESNELSDSQIADNIIGVIFAAHDTTASVLTWLLKYLHDYPNVLHAVTVTNYSLHPFIDVTFSFFVRPAKDVTFLSVGARENSTEASSRGE